MSDARDPQHTALGPHDSCPVSSQRLHKIVADMVDTLIGLKVPKPLVDSSTQLEELRILEKWIHRYEESLMYLTPEPGVPPTIPMPVSGKAARVAPARSAEVEQKVKRKDGRSK